MSDGSGPAARPRRRVLQQVLGRVLRALPAVAWAAGMWAMSSLSDPPGASLLEIPYLDKVAHAGLFFVLAVLLRFAGAGWAATVAIAVAWGGVDELHQAGVAGRDSSGLDLAADLAGAVLGVIVVTWFAHRRRAAR